MIFSSPHPDVTIPEVPLTEFVLAGARERGDKAAFVDGPSGRTLTYGGVAEAVDQVAAGLAARGLRAGDVLALYAPNTPEYAVAFLAVAALGGTNTTANPLLTAPELATQLEDCRARFLVTVPSLLGRALEAADATEVEEVFSLGEAEGAASLTSLRGSGRAPRVEIDPRSHVVALPYSSGTTGWPKGVMLTHRNLVANLCQMKPVHRVGERDTVIGILPFFHIYGMTVVMNLALHGGATIVTMPRFDLEQFLELMQAHGVTRAELVPPVVLALAKHPLVERYDLSPLRSIMSGAAPLGADVAQACARRLGCNVVQGYGLTETSPVTHVTPDVGEHKDGSIGPPLPNTECKVVDVAGGAELGPGETGEIWVRGPQVMSGYLNNPEATRAAIDDDGWLRTGDLGYADVDSYFFVVDRLKELIKYKGYQVAPAELEALLLSHPAVADAAVIPSPDEEAGEVPKAFVVTSDEIDSDELMSFVADRVAPHKRIRSLETIDAIPKSPSGKILRRVLVERERSG